MDPEKEEQAHHYLHLKHTGFSLNSFRKDRVEDGQKEDRICTVYKPANRKNIDGENRKFLSIPRASLELYLQKDSSGVQRHQEVSLHSQRNHHAIFNIKRD